MKVIGKKKLVTLQKRIKTQQMCAILKAKGTPMKYVCVNMCINLPVMNFELINLSKWPVVTRNNLLASINIKHINRSKLYFNDLYQR